MPVFSTWCLDFRLRSHDLFWQVVKSFYFLPSFNTLCPKLLVISSSLSIVWVLSRALTEADLSRSSFSVTGHVFYLQNFSANQVNTHLYTCLSTELTWRRVPVNSVHWCTLLINLWLESFHIGIQVSIISGQQFRWLHACSFTLKFHSFEDRISIVTCRCRCSVQPVGR